MVERGALGRGIAAGVGHLAGGVERGRGHDRRRVEVVEHLHREQQQDEEDHDTEDGADEAGAAVVRPSIRRRSSSRWCCPGHR